MLSIYLSMVETEEEKDLVTELYNTYKQILFNVSMSILHNTADAEDAVQETFVRIISNLSKIDCANEKRSNAYIFVVTRNICYDILRKKHKVVFLEEDRELVDTNAVDNTEILTDVLTVQNNIKNAVTFAEKCVNLVFCGGIYSRTNIRNARYKRRICL